MRSQLDKIKTTQVLQSATLRDFSGGLNTLDDDLNLARKYSRRLDNIRYDGANANRVRFGTEFHVDINDYTTSSGNALVNATYFQANLIAVASNGEILAVAADKSTTRIFDSVIAAALPGAPAGWSATDFCSFAVFNNELIICNGVDKPLLVRNDLSVEYLADQATGSNINTPIGKYVTVCNRYLIISGDPVNPTRVHISAKDTSGTFYGDPAPNDATYVDVGSSLLGSTLIRGIADFRGKLVVAFAEGIVIGTVGIYDTTGVIHEPVFDDNVEEHGGISHRTLLSFGDDMLYLGLQGIPALKRTIFTGSLRPEYISDIIAEDLLPLMSPLSDGALEDNTFSVYDQREGVFMFFVPNASTVAETTETKCFCYTYRPNLRVEAWNTYSGWNWTCAVKTLQGNIFFGTADGKLFRFGNKENPVYKDFVGDYAVNNGEGAAINFDWELAWAEFGSRVETKTTRYISFDTRGSGAFTCDMYCDQLMTDADGNDAPQLTMDFTGGDNQGFGSSLVGYGGGRTTGDERLYGWPAKFKLAKLRFRGAVEDELAFVSITLFFMKGGYLR